jgi:YegS/Rv2252/BmrU family lipid kinase
MRKIAAIINTGAGAVAGLSILNAVQEAFDKHPVQVRVIAARGPDLLTIARSLRDEGFDVIAAAGGDGTVSTIASVLVGHDTALGVLPTGTLNHFARDLGVPLDLGEAVALVCTGAARPVDVGMVNGNTFINNSSLGLYPDQVRVRQRWQSRVGKWLALLVASFAVLQRFPNLRVTLEYNGKRMRQRCPLVLISNNPYKFEPGNLTQRERVDEGLLGVYLLRDEGRAGLFRLALHSLVFKLEEAASFESDRATKVVVTTNRRRVRVALDGEVYKFRSPLLYSAVPGGLNVISF